MTSLQQRLVAGHESRLFNLQSWDYYNGRASATLTLEAPLEDVVEVLWGDGRHPVALSLVEARRPPARETRCRTVLLALRASA